MTASKPHANEVTLLQLLDQWCRKSAGQALLVDYEIHASRSAGKPVFRTRLTGDQLWEQVIRTAAWLRLQGVVPGDVVAVQLPTWHEYLVTHMAAYAVGAVTMPVSTIFRTLDLSRQLVLSRAKVLVVPSSYGNFDFCAMARELRASVDTLQILVAVGAGDPGDAIPWSTVQADGAAAQHAALRAEIAAGQHACARSDFMLLNYSSGTTGEPKGIMHSTHSVLTAVNAAAKRLELDGNDVLFVAVTLGHAAGYLNGIYLPLALGAKTVYQDLWDADVALRVLEEEGVTYAPAMPAFLYDLAHHPRFTVTNLHKWTRARVSGAAISRPLMALLQEHVPHLRLCPGWGLSEVLYASCGSPHDPVDKRNKTEGRILDGYRIEIRDPLTWTPLPAGSAGEIVIDAPSLMMGYYRQEALTRSAFTADGWLKTGDLGKLDEEGYLTFVGRSKELIIRGGENIPVVEVEQLLRAHDKVAEVALVGVPDERLGERACAVVLGKPDAAPPELAELRDYLIGRGLTRQFIPEHLVTVAEMPKTAIGKIKKHELRLHVLATLGLAPAG